MARITEIELEHLVDELGPALVLFARQWCSCPDDALQEALIELAKKDPCPRSAKAWIFRVVRNKAMNLARSERRRSHHESSVTSPDLWFESDRSSPIDKDALIQTIQLLPDIQRQIVTSRIWGELTFAQVAEIVDRPAATVFRLFQEAIDSMRQHLASQVDRKQTHNHKNYES